jgi:hypothetical protein
MPTLCPFRARAARRLCRTRLSRLAAKADGLSQADAAVYVIVVGWRFVRVAIRFGVVWQIGRAGHLLPRPAQEGRNPLSGDAEALGDLVHCQAFGVQRTRLGPAHAGSTDVERF